MKNGEPRDTAGMPRFRYTGLGKNIISSCLKKRADLFRNNTVEIVSEMKKWA